MDPRRWVDLKLTGIGATVFAIIWALTHYSVRVANPELRAFAGVSAVVLAVLTVADALRGGISD
ncbi:hypothetical protein [Haladaptatus salinisoli]|uniref:hypothetical protein n=1 Tax=Haladaptatus salinisoli TaxID=2884876 RepID=UPI001D0B1CCB|nr:hypothetical protein [Haladaptatus salinisoli]